MRHRMFAVALAVLAGHSGSALACPCTNLAATPTIPIQTVAEIIIAEQSQVALKIGGITCASCPQIVHRALSDVAGVRDVELRATDDDTTLIAIVSCDGDVSADRLAAATNGLGYPTTVIGDES